MYLCRGSLYPPFLELFLWDKFPGLESLDQMDNQVDVS